MSLMTLVALVACTKPSQVPSEIEALVLARVSGSPQISDDSRKELDKFPFNENIAHTMWMQYKSLKDEELKKDFDKSVVRTRDREAPYRWRTVGAKPQSGGDS